MPCEMCGKDAPLKKAIVEGNEMRVCSDCAKFGKVVEPPKSRGGGGSAGGGRAARQRQAGGPPSSGGGSPPPRRKDVFSSDQKVLVEDYGERVRKARQTKGWTPEELSDQINEKKSVISHTEAQEHHPSDKLVRKLERALDITLMETPEHTELAQSSGKKRTAGPVTLGDLLKEQMDQDE